MRIAPYILVALVCCWKISSTNVIVENNLDGVSKITLDETMKYMESMSGSRFLHAKDPDFIISMKFGPVPEYNRKGFIVLGFAHPGLAKCEITLSEDINPENPKHISGVDLSLVMMHEIGHCFGLSHDENDPTSIMYPSTEPEVQRVPYSLFRFFRDLNEARGVSFDYL